MKFHFVSAICSSLRKTKTMIIVITCSTVPNTTREIGVQIGHMAVVNNCHMSNLNGLYLSGPEAPYCKGVNWLTFRGYHYSLKRTEMKVKTKA